MRISEATIRQVIREEASRLLTESEDFDGNTGMPSNPSGVAIKLRNILAAVDKSKLSNVDRQVLNFTLKAIDPGNTAANSFMQQIIGQINFSAVEVDRRRAKSELETDLARRQGAQRGADQARQGIRSFDPDTGKPIYSESRRPHLREGASASSVFNRIKDICEEALMNKSLGMKPAIAARAADRVKDALKDI
jgi:hypothetical protein